ncbi:hypothetical protein K9M79_02885 [Candidatus Woesearchaeota archaeon]|nr:hypothetical protein [Candidatus Woesearchaeota archaeon]
MDNLDRELKRTLGFKPNLEYLDPEGITFLQHLGEYGQRSEWISKACQFYYDYEKRRKGFFIRLIDNHFEAIKHILRIIGRRRKKDVMQNS